jgi:putative transposase
MPRIARIIIPDVPYHVTQRGNNRQDVFFTDDDRRACLGWVRTAS